MMENNFRIDIIGKGNVGSHLYKAMSPKADVKLIDSRSLKGLRPDSNLYIVSVTDSVINEIVKKIHPLVSDKSLIVHTSGSAPLQILEDLHPLIGVFYPLQTFTKNSELNYSEIPVFLETNNGESEKIIDKIATIWEGKTYYMDSEKRKDLHIAAVFACNFVNHLWTLSSKYLSSNGLKFEYIIPLIIETTNKIKHMTPEQAQTGPAVRRDFEILRNHEQKLSENKQLLEIYKLLSNSIINS